MAELNYQALRAELVRVCCRLDKLGFAPASSGNVSARTDAGSVLITPSGAGLGEVTEAALVEVGMDGTVAGKGRPSIESCVHWVFYRGREDVNAVIHVHSPGCMAFAMAQQDFGEPSSLEMLVHVGRPVLVPFAPAGESGPVLTPRLQSAECFLLANHGVVVVGGTLREALLRTEMVENFACSLIGARQLGGAAPFSAEEMSRIDGFMDRVGAPRPRSMLP